MIAKYAKFQVIIFAHDYFVFDIDWYNSFSKVDNFDITMCEILSPEGLRYHDWTIWSQNGNFMDLIVVGNRGLLQYSIGYLKDFMYFSGSFWISTKEFMLTNPLDESLYWGESEDVEWSLRVRNKAKIIMIEGSVVRSLKKKPIIVKQGGFFTKIIFRLAGWKMVQNILAKELPRSLKYYCEIRGNFSFYFRKFISKFSSF